MRVLYITHITKKGISTKTIRGISSFSLHRKDKVFKHDWLYIEIDNSDEPIYIDLLPSMTFRFIDLPW